MVHRREAKLRLQERRIRRIIYAAASHDRELCETVSQVSRLDIVEVLAEPIQLSLVPDIMRGRSSDRCSRQGKPPTLEGQW